MLSMSLLSFHEIEFSFDRNFTLNKLANLKILLDQLVTNHLTQKSLDRIESVFNFFHKNDLLDDFFHSKKGTCIPKYCRKEFNNF